MRVMWLEIVRAVADRMWALLGAVVSLMVLFLNEDDRRITTVAVIAMVVFGAVFIVQVVVEVLDIRSRHTLAARSQSFSMPL